MSLPIGSIHETRINYKKLLTDLREQYPHEPLVTLVVESFANSLDAKATCIEIQVSDEWYQIKDNGKGMTEYEFKEYHNIASLTKVKGKGGIGFAGIGAKVYLDLAECIITETKSSTFHGASKWSFVEGDSVPRWEVIPPSEAITDTGTVIKVKLNPEDRGKLTKERVIKILRENYNAVLLGYYGIKEVKVNNEKVEAWSPRDEDIDKKDPLEIKIGRHKVKGFFIKTKEKVPEEFQGISIVVCGKTIYGQEWFRQYPLSSEKITGMVIADYLIDIVTTSKTQLNKNTQLWRKFYAKISREFAKWLEKIGERPIVNSPPQEVHTMVKDIEKSINSILLENPEFSSLANSFFQNIVERSTVIENKDGEVGGVYVEGAQSVPGTLGGPGEGGGVETIGAEDGTGIIESDTGNVRSKRVIRRMKSGIKISFYNKPGDEEGWIDPASQTITINTGHPSYKIACGLTIEGLCYHVWVYHIVRVVIKVLSREAEGDQKTIENNFLSKLYDFWFDETKREEIERFLSQHALT